MHLITLLFFVRISPAEILATKPSRTRLASVWLQLSRQSLKAATVCANVYSQESGTLHGPLAIALRTATFTSTTASSQRQWPMTSRRSKPPSPLRF